MSPRSGTALLLTAALALAGFDARAQSAKTPAATTAPAQSAPATQKPVSMHEKNEASQAFLEGAKALKKDDLRTAEKQFERATKLDPGNTDYSTALTIAKEHLLTQLVQEASKARLTGHDDTARSLLAQAYLLDPNNPIV